MNRIEEIHQITREELRTGKHDIHDYFAILYGLRKEEDYEAMEGIKRAIEEYGILLDVPESEEELDEWMREIESMKKKYMGQ